MAAKPAPANEASRPVVVYDAQRVASNDSAARIRRLIPAWIISFVVHAGLILAFVSIDFSHAEGTRFENVVFETDVEENTKMPNLDNEDIGNDSEILTNFNVPRIEEISVPGPVNMAENVGIPDAAQGPPMTLPPPPGIGGNIGTGGGIDDPTRVGSGNLMGLAGGMGGKLIPGGFGGRSGSTRQQLINEGGGNTESEAAVAAALRWLTLHQAPAGNWSLRDFNVHGNCKCSGFGSADNDVAATAFGLLPLLGAGQTHKPTADKATQRYAKNVDRGLKYLILKQNREGAFFAKASANTHMYAHGLATIAMCEAYALTGDPALRRPAQSALNYIARAQTPEGGWRYEAKGATGFDTSVGGWQVMALKSGQMAGLDVPRVTVDGASKFLDAACSSDQGSYGYTSNVDTTDTLSAVGLLCRQYLGWGPRSPGLIAGSRRLLKTGPRPDNMYYNYYATQVMHHLGGPAWEAWNPRMRDQLCALQDKGTKNQHQKGSWDPKGDGFGSHGGRIMSTSLSVLTLEVYYRHLPLYRQVASGDKVSLDK